MSASRITRPITRLAVAIAAMLVLGGCSAGGIGGITVVTHGEHRLAAGERIPGWVAVGGGTFEVGAGAGVEGSVLVGDGRLRVAGTIAGDVAAVGGVVEVEPGGTVRGEVSLTGSATAVVAPDAVVAGGVRRAIDGGLAPSPVAAALGAILRALGLTLLVLVVRRTAPGRARTAARLLAARPVPSLAYGFLVALVGISLVVFMAYTLVLVPVALVGFLALGLAVLVGLAAALELLVGRLGRGRGIAMVVLAIALLPEVPVVGVPVTALALLALVGAVGLGIQRPHAGDRPAAA